MRIWLAPFISVRTFCGKSTFSATESMNWAGTTMMFDIAVAWFAIGGTFAIMAIVAESEVIGEILAYFDEDGE